MIAVFTGAPAMAQVVNAPAVTTGPGGIIDNSGLIVFEQAFFAFEVESPLGTLKEVPIWDEIELMLDNPYAYGVEPPVAAGGTEGNFQGFPAYRLNQSRRHSFLPPGCDYNVATAPPQCNDALLPKFIVHPLNYNHMTGEEMRLLNITYEGGPGTVVGLLQPVDGQPGSYAFEYVDIEVSPGEERIEDDETAPDFNSPMGPRTAFTVPNCTDAGPFTECTIESVDTFYSPGPSPFSPGTINTGEGAFITGGTPAEPGYLGFGTTGNAAARAAAYSLPAVPLGGQGVPGGSVRSGIESARHTHSREQASLRPGARVHRAAQPSSWGRRKGGCEGPL